MKYPLALAAASILAGAAAPASADRSDRQIVHVAIYRGPAGCEDCSEAIGRAIAKLGRRYRIDYVGPGEAHDITPATLRHYALYVQPGGGQDLDGAAASLGPRRIAAIRGFVAQGGGYLGLCMGAYLAGASHVGLIADDPDGEVARPGFAVSTIADAAVPVRWAGRVQPLYFQDGPYLRAHPDDRHYRTVATYQNGDVAAARYSYGRGAVVLSGPHPEADRSWYDDADLPEGQMPAGEPIRALIDQFDG